MTLQNKIAKLIDPTVTTRMAELAGDLYWSSEETRALGAALNESSANLRESSTESKKLSEDLAQVQAESQVLRASLETFYDVLRDEIVSIRSPAAMIAELQESGYDTGMLDLMVNQLGWDQIGGMGEGSAQERTAAVEQAVRLFRYSPLAQWSIWLWTGWDLQVKGENDD